MEAEKCENGGTFSLTRHALFGDLPVIDLLLQGEVTHQPVDMTRLPLTVAVDAAHRLGVVTRVPRRVENHHTVRSDQVYAQTTSPESHGNVSTQPDDTQFLEMCSCCRCYLVDRRKTHAEVLEGSLNWLMSLSLSEAVVLPSSPLTAVKQRCKRF